MYQDRSAFNFEIDHNVGNNLLHPKDVQAIERLMSENLAPDSLKKKYYIDRHTKEARDTYRNTRKWILGWNKELLDSPLLH